MLLSSVDGLFQGVSAGSSAEPAQVRVRAPSTSAMKQLLTTVDPPPGSSLLSQPILETEEDSDETKSETQAELDRLLKRQKQLQHELARQVRQLTKLEQEERDWL
jgi:hypothetical protein